MKDDKTMQQQSAIELERELARTISRNMDETTPRARRPNPAPESWRQVASVLSWLMAMVVVALLVSLGAGR
jgi:hypothetical protein